MIFYEKFDWDNYSIHQEGKSSIIYDPFFKISCISVVVNASLGVCSILNKVFEYQEISTGFIHKSGSYTKTSSIQI